MLKIIKQNIIFPATRRIGTALAAWLVARGVDAAPSEQIAVGGMALVLVMVDLFISWYERRDNR